MSLIEEYNLYLQKLNYMNIFAKTGLGLMVVVTLLTIVVLLPWLSEMKELRSQNQEQYGVMTFVIPFILLLGLTTIGTSVVNTLSTQDLSTGDINAPATQEQKDNRTLASSVTIFNLASAVAMIVFGFIMVFINESLEDAYSDMGNLAIKLILFLSFVQTNMYSIETFLLYKDPHGEEDTSAFRREFGTLGK